MNRSTFRMFDKSLAVKNILLYNILAIHVLYIISDFYLCKSACKDNCRHTEKPLKSKNRTFTVCRNVYKIAH